MVIAGRRRVLRLVTTLSVVAFMVAIAGCPTVDLGEEPAAPGACRPDPAYFSQVIWPEFVEGAAEPGSSCIAASGCHDSNNNGRSSLRFQTLAPIDFQLNYDITTRFLNCGTPEASAALTKPLSGVNSHGGGDIIAPNGASMLVFIGWFDI